uniref:G-protein coupled receptors family 1 profile domain-containing protein n=1 Tax=Electrophorus electricus TaxID=8005 RepID=A0A4W4ERK3_ELEEL
MGLFSVFDCISLTVCSFTFLLGLPANLLVFFMYIHKANRRGGTPNVVYGINLCLSNLVLVAWMPVKVVEMLLQSWMLPELLCPIYNFFLFASLYGGGLLLTAVAVGRYLSIAFPITYKLYRRARASCLVCALLWTIVLLHQSFTFMAEKGGYVVCLDQRNTSRCYENFTQEQLDVLVPLRLEMALLLFAVPLLLSAMCTLRCLALVRRSRLPAGGKRRVLAAELLALAAFVVCYAPYNASHVAGFVQNGNVEWKRVALIPSSCNVFLDPIMTLMLGRCAGLKRQQEGVVRNTKAVK